MFTPVSYKSVLGLKVWLKMRFAEPIRHCTPERLKRGLYQKGGLALLASALFSASYFLLTVIVWAAGYQVGEYSSGWVQHLSPVMFMRELKFDLLLGGLFYPLFFLTPRCMLLAMFAGVWLWQLYELAFYYQDVGTSTFFSVLYFDIAPYSPAIILSLLPALWLLYYAIRVQRKGADNNVLDPQS